MNYECKNLRGTFCEKRKKECDPGAKGCVLRGRFTIPFRKESSNIPEIRFKGFTDAWEQRKLGEIGYSYTGLSGKTKEDFGHGQARFITYMNVFSNPISRPEMTESIEIDSKQNEIEIGDVFFTVSSETPEEVGMSSVLLKKQGRTYLNSFCFGFRPIEKFDSYYLAYVLRSDAVREKIIPLAQGISRYNISKNKVMEIAISVPSLGEQKTIGKFFKNLDHLLTLHQRECEKLQNVKKSCLEKMFPKDGSNVPEIRFKGFTDAWEQRKVSKIGNIVTGSTPQTSVDEYYGGEFLFVSPADIQENRYVDETITNLTKKGFDQGRKIRKNASLFVCIGSTIGKVAQTSRESTTNQQINAVESYETFDDDFVFTSLENISESIKTIASNQAVPIVNKTTFGEIKLAVPSGLNEQMKIGQFFSHLDHLLTLHQRECEKLQNLKKACLEKMFI